MKLVYKNPIELGKIFSAISVIANEVNLNFDEYGLSVFGLDGSHVSMVLLKLNRNDCVEYNCEEAIRLGINLKTLTGILSTGKDNDSVEIENIDKEALNIVIKNEGKRVEYEIKLMEIEMDDLMLPEMNYPVKLSTSAIYFYNLLESMGVVLLEGICISLKQNSLIISGTGQLGNARVELSEGNEYQIEYEEGEDIEQSYAFVFIMKSKKLGEVSKKIEVLIGNEMPIQIKYKIGKESEVNFMLAPKIE